MKSLKTKNLVAKYKKYCIAMYRMDTGVKTIQEIINFIVKNSEVFSKDEDIANKFKGDMWEIFVEIFFNKFDADPEVGLTDYCPIDINDDLGVDGTGRNPNGILSVAQAKFKRNPTDLITWQDLSKTDSIGRRRYNLSVEDNTIFVITTANSNCISAQARDALGSSIRLISKELIMDKIDKNDTFWRYAEQRISETLYEIDSPPPDIT